MNQIKIGHFEADGGLVYIPCGFIPDFVWLLAKGAASGNLIKYIWFREMEDHDTLDGWIDTPNAAPAQIAAASGFAAFDTGSEGPTITEWSSGMTGTARTSTAHGTYAKATTSGVDVNGNEIDRSAIFECVTAGTAHTSEPVWPHIMGENGPSDNGVIWQKVNVATKRVGYQGFRLAASMTGLANGNEGYFIAIGSGGNVEDYGDVDGWTSGVRGA